MKVDLARHFESLPVEGVPNQWNHTNFAGNALQQMNLFRAQMEADKIPFPVRLFGYSSAPRTWYSLLTGILGIYPNMVLVQIPHVYPEPSAARDVMEEAYSVHGADLSLYDDEEIEAVDRLGGLAADAIRKAASEADLSDEGRMLIFGHAPMLNAIAANLCGSSLGRTPALRFPIGEGDRIKVNTDTKSFWHVALVG